MKAIPEDARSLFLFLANTVYEAKIEGVIPVRDVTDFAAWMLELAEESRPEKRVMSWRM